MKDFKVLNIGNIIGGGNTGQLYNAQIKYEGRKIDCLAKLVNLVSFEDSIKAHNLMADVDNKHLMKVYGSKRYNDKEYIFIEHIQDSCDLYSYLYNGNINCSLVVNIANSLGKAIEAMHQNKIKHGDIHLGNVMFSPINNTFKLIDFDMAKENSDLKHDCEQYAMAIAHVLIFYTKQKEIRPCSGSYQKDLSCLNEIKRTIIKECQIKINAQINGNMANFSSNMILAIDSIIKETICEIGCPMSE